MKNYKMIIGESFINNAPVIIDFLKDFLKRVSYFQH